MAADKSVVTALAATDLFSALSRRSLETIAARAKIVQHAAGRQITTEGDGAAGFHLIIDGTATVSVGDEVRAQIGPGRYFGEISLIDGGPRSATVTTDTAVSTIFLSVWDFKPILQNEPEVARALLLVMCKRLRAAERK